MARSIAYLGPPGTYSEEAAVLYDPDAELRSFPSIAAVGLAVSSGITDQGIVPIENSLEGPVNFTLDLLVSQSDLYICQEVVLPIQHFLMAQAGTRPSDLQVIYSHPQSLGQCRDFLERCFPGVQQMASLSNSAAVFDMKESALPRGGHRAGTGRHSLRRGDNWPGHPGQPEQRDPLRGAGQARPRADGKRQDFHVPFIRAGRPRGFSTRRWPSSPYGALTL